MTTTGSMLDMLSPVYEAFAGGHYAYCAALGIILLVALIKRYGGDMWPALHGDLGGSLLTLAAAAATAMATALAVPGAHITLALLKSSLLVGVGAAGGYSMLKRLAMPALLALQAKLPLWAQPICRLVLWIFDKPTAVDAQVAAATAGAAAVAAAPPQGAAATAGKPTDVA